MVNKKTTGLDCPWFVDSVLEKSINRRNPAQASTTACRGTNGIDVVIVDYHVGNSKTNRCDVKRLRGLFFGEGEGLAERKTFSLLYFVRRCSKAIADGGMMKFYGFPRK